MVEEYAFVALEYIGCVNCPQDSDKNPGFAVRVSCSPKLRSQPCSSAYMATAERLDRVW